MVNFSKKDIFYIIDFIISSILIYLLNIHLTVTNSVAGNSYFTNCNITWYLIVLYGFGLFVYKKYGDK